MVDDSVDWSQYIDADEILPSADYDDYDYVESGSSSDGKQLESIEERECCSLACPARQAEHGGS